MSRINLMLSGILIAGALVLAGCGPALVIRAYEPSRVNVGKIKVLVITKADGSTAGRKLAADYIAIGARSTGYFLVENRSEDNVKLELDHRRAIIKNDSKGISDREMYIRADFVDWNSHTYAVTRRVPVRRRGRTYYRTEVTRYWVGNAVIAVTLARSDGSTIMVEREYHAETRGSQYISSWQRARKSALKKAVFKMLRDITPRMVSRSVKLDNSDKALEHIIKTAEKGAIASAADALTEFIKRNPKNAAAHYNLAVFTDALGNYGEAVRLHDTAIRLGGKDFYGDARAGAARRLANEKALSQ